MVAEVGSHSVVSPAHMENSLTAVDVIDPEIWMFLSLNSWKKLSFSREARMETSCEPDWSSAAFSDKN